VCVCVRACMRAGVLFKSLLDHPSKKTVTFAAQCTDAYCPLQKKISCQKNSYICGSQFPDAYGPDVRNSHKARRMRRAKIKKQKLHKNSYIKKKDKPCLRGRRRTTSESRYICTRNTHTQTHTHTHSLTHSLTQTHAHTRKPQMDTWQKRVRERTHISNTLATHINTH